MVILLVSRTLCSTCWDEAEGTHLLGLVHVDVGCGFQSREAACLTSAVGKMLRPAIGMSQKNVEVS